MADVGSAGKAAHVSVPLGTAPLLATLALVLVALAAAVRAPARGSGPAWWQRWNPDDLESELSDGLGTGPDLGGWAPVAQLLAAAGLLVVIVVLARRLILLVAAGRLAGRVWRGRVAPAGGRVRWAADETAYGDALARAAEVGADELDLASRPGTSPAEISDAVVAAWVRLESVAADLGEHRRTQDTAAEFAADLIQRRRVAANVIDGLLQLYSRARFSAERLGVQDGLAARDALAQVHRDLVGAVRQ